MAWFASDQLREAAGSGTDFTGLFFIVTWINSYRSATQVPESGFTARLSSFGKCL
jgi:hypothetical protein